jgi:nicotinamide-nucleotide amidase
MEVKINTCSKLMAEKGLTIAFAESATAGWLCSEFALTEESGKVLKGGIACYDASLKVSLLGVPQQLIDRFTPESMEVTSEMTYRLKDIIPSDIQVTVTGLTAPGGSETPEKPVGTMFIFALIKGRETSFRKVFKGPCEAIIHQTIEATADLLINELNINSTTNEQTS